MMMMMMMIIIILVCADGSRGGRAAACAWNAAPGRASVPALRGPETGKLKLLFTICLNPKLWCLCFMCLFYDDLFICVFVLFLQFVKSKTLDVLL